MIRLMRQQFEGGINMMSRYEVLARNYGGCQAYEYSKHTDSIFKMILSAIRCKIKGYDIVNISYRRKGV